MISSFDSSWIVSAITVVIPTIVICLAALFFVRKIVSTATLRKNHDVVGFTFSIIGVLYSVVLGFTVVSSKERFSDAEKNLLTEVFALADLYRDASFFPPKERNAIRNCLREYIDCVIKKEWGISSSEKKLHLQSQDIAEKLSNIYYRMDVKSDIMSIWYTESISKLNVFMDASLARHFSSRSQLDSMMWTLLILGAMITVGFMFFFGLEDFNTQMLMTAFLAGYLSFMLFLVYSLDHVFEGPTGIKPVMLEELTELFDQWDGR